MVKKKKTPLTKLLVCDHSFHKYISKPRQGNKIFLADIRDY